MSKIDDFQKPVTIEQNTGGGNYPEEGWEEVTIKTAKYELVGQDEKLVLKLTFEDYAEHLNLSVWATFGRDGDEFIITQLFQQANAIVSIQNVPGKKPLIVLERDPMKLIGKKINVFFYKMWNYSSDNDKWYNSTRAYKYAPAIQLKPSKNTIQYTAKDVEYWENRVEGEFQTYQKHKVDAAEVQHDSESFQERPESPICKEDIPAMPDSDDDIPF